VLSDEWAGSVVGRLRICARRQYSQYRTEQQTSWAQQPFAQTAAPNANLIGGWITQL
jgi:hypothetical protein